MEPIAGLKGLLSKNMFLSLQRIQQWIGNLTRELVELGTLRCFSLMKVMFIYPSSHKHGSDPHPSWERWDKLSQNHTKPPSSIEKKTLASHILYGPTRKMNQQNPSWINKGTGDSVFLGIRSTLQASALQQRVERIQEAFEAGSGCWRFRKKKQWLFNTVDGWNPAFTSWGW